LKFGGFGWADRALGMALGVFLGLIVPGLLLYIIIAIKGDFKGTVFEHAAFTPYISGMIKFFVHQ